MNLLVKYKEFFGLPVWETVSLENLYDRAQNAWERWYYSAKHLRESPLHIATSWNEIRNLERRVKEYKKEYELAHKAVEERLKYEVRKMRKEGENQKIFEGQLVICSVVLDGDNFLIRLRLIPRE